MAERPGGNRSVVLFDAGCGLCSRLVAAVAALPRSDELLFVPLGGDRARGMLRGRAGQDELPDSVLVLPARHPERAEPLSKSAAVTFIARRLSWPWRALAVIGWLPERLLDRCYDEVARARRMLGPPAGSCPWPGPTERRAAQARNAAAQPARAPPP